MNDIKISQFNIKYPNGEVKPAVIQLPISAITGLEEILTIINSSAGGAFGVFGVFENYQDLVTKLFDATIKTYASPGMSIYIGQSNVPDLWIKEVKEISNPFTYTNEEDFIDKIKSGYQFGYYILSLQEVEIPYNIFIAKPTPENFNTTGLVRYNPTTGLIDRMPTYQSVPAGGQMPIAKAGGRLATNTPEDDLDCANKKYVDDNFRAKYNRTAAETGGWFVYTQNQDGVDNVLQLANTVMTGKSTIPFRDPRGCIAGVGTPQNNDDAANKQYVDDGFVAKATDATGYPQAYAKAPDGSQTRYNVTSDVVNSAIAQRRSDGTISVPTNTALSNAAISKYQADISYVPSITLATGQPAKAYIVNANGQAQIDLIPNEAKQWTIPQRGADGVIYTGTPTAESHATTKKYVDDKFLAKKTGLTGEVIITQKPDGTTDNLAYSTDIANLYMVRRTINGDVLVPDMPVSPYGAVNKNYVENKINNIETSHIKISSSDRISSLDSEKISLSQNGLNYEYKLPQDSGYLSISKMPKIRLHGIVYEGDCLSGGKILVEVLEDGLQEGDIIQICKRKRVYCEGNNRIQNSKSERVIFRQVKSAGNKYPLRTIVTSEDIEINKRLFTIDISDDFTSSKRSNLSRQGTYCVRIRRPFYKTVPSGSSGADAGKEIEFKAIFSNEVTFRTRTYTSDRVIDDMSPSNDKLPIAIA